MPLGVHVILGQEFPKWVPLQQQLVSGSCKKGELLGLSTGLQKYPFSKSPGNFVVG